MKGKDVLKGLIDAGKPIDSLSAVAPTQRPAGAIKALNLGLNRLSEEAAEAKHLREALARSENVVDLDPSIIDSSIVADRLVSTTDTAFDELKTAIQTSGQQVPVLLRPNPEVPGRYQAAYGHRRIRAARELGINIKAVIKELSDEQMVVAQGQENGTRVDLSFIERALFAHRLDQRGFDRDTLCLALGVDKPEISRLLTVAGSIDHSIVEAIGPAPKVGRPRWLQLAELLNEPGAMRSIASLIQTAPFISADSNTRFKLALTTAVPSTKPVSIALKEFKSGDKKIAVMDRKSGQAKLIIADDDFSEFLENRMSDLIGEYIARKRVIVS
ncbi:MULTISPECIES: plasmid partitioning protein RepB [Brucella/Ochrobactrum group]|jgi:ParB family transcriptional regulator, chromosome partitioning protein|uniref:plasmid partitioning protein RepB n=1 Tax=Brucella/Ochrobactrum group TaxID=2826938 RepID=UPI0004ED9427|nr:MULTISPECIES: plasmid partitioning protein RepB [Brucella/Ochrobactrum group]AIK40918.1 plasmid partitioning protein RepB [Brucella anthropi]KAB2747445.1 plasmid partitioning protein RepB [Brucella anthropi]